MKKWGFLRNAVKYKKIECYKKIMKWDCFFDNLLASTPKNQNHLNLFNSGFRSIGDRPLDWFFKFSYVPKQKLRPKWAN